MRVALVPSAYPPTLGGVQELSRNLALALRDAGHDVEVWWQQLDDVDRPSIETADGLVIRRFPFPLPNARASSWLPFAPVALRTMHALRQAVKSFRPDVLHVQCFGPNGAYMTALSRLTGVPLVVTLQGETVMDDHDIFEHSVIIRAALRAGIKQAALVTGCSGFTLDDARDRFGLPTGAGEVVFNGVVVGEETDYAMPDGSVPGAGTGIDGRYVLAMGRVVEKKGFDLLIRAFARVAARHPDVSLAIGGDGPARGDLDRLVTELGLGDRVQLLGRLSRTEVAARLEHADVFVMPSRLEPFGIVVLEGWRAGRPVIATSHGGPPEFVDDGRTGLLVDPFNTEQLAKALDRLLSDADYRTALGRAGREQLADFAWPVIADQYVEGYAKAVSARSSSRRGPSNRLEEQPPV